MDKTNLDELTEYPNKILKLISENKECVALLLNKKVSTITEDDMDEVLDSNLFDYEYVDYTTTQTGCYVGIEAEVAYVINKQIKNLRIYVTVSCHKNYMKINENIIPKLTGNRRDNVVKYIDKLLNNSDIFGIGRLKLEHATVKSSANGNFTHRELCYFVPDFNVKDN